MTFFGARATGGTISFFARALLCWDWINILSKVNFYIFSDLAHDRWSFYVKADSLKTSSVG